ncbi:MAG: hypothetical protein JJU03_09155 [Idiomarina sp.]|nr:hypothetical protein [Idiomarina sp.]
MTTTVAFGLAYKRKYMVSGFEKNLEQAILHLKDIEKDISLLGEKGAEARYRYNLACYQSLGGHFDSAELNLEKAIELNDRYGIQLRTDEDLVPLLAARPAAFEATNVDTSPGK